VNSFFSGLRFVRRCIKQSCKAAAWPVFAGLLVIVAIVITLVRFWLPDADHYRADIEEWTSSYIGMPVTLGSVHVRWHKLRPQLVIRDACLHKKIDEPSVACVKEAHLALDLLATLQGGVPELGDLTLVGLNLPVLHRSDGSFSIIGLEDMPTDLRTQVVVQQWLMKQDHLVIKDSQLRWRDERSGQERQFIRVHLGLHNNGERHYLSGTVAMMPDPATRIKVALELQGNIFEGNGWSGKGYVEGVAVELASWLAGRTLADVGMGAGESVARGLDFKLWGTWQNARLQRVQGEAALTGLHLKNSAAQGCASVAGGRSRHPASRDTSASMHVAGCAGATGMSSLFLHKLAGHFDWRRNAQGWRLDADRVVLARAGDANNIPAREEVATKKINFKVALTRQGNATMVEVGAHDVLLQDAVAMMLLSNLVDDATREALTAMQPRAQLGNAYVRYWHDEAADKHTLAARANFNDLAFSGWKNLPTVTGLDGSVQVNDQSGSLVLDTAKAQLSFDGLFRAPLSLDTLSGSVAWRHQDGGWRIQTPALTVANADIDGSVQATIDIPDNHASPFISLVADFSNAQGRAQAKGSASVAGGRMPGATKGNVEHAARYLPVSIMPQDTVAWLDRALVGGTVTQGQALFHGRVADFPFDTGASQAGGQLTGRFEVRFNVSEGILDYAPGWPRLENIETEVVFSERRMEINAVAARSLESQIQQVQVTIEDLGGNPPVLIIRGQAEGPTADVLRYVRETPLDKKIGKYLESARAQGRSTLDLEIQMPLAATATDRIKGTLGFDNSSLAFIDMGMEGGVKFSQVKGALNFTESTLRARNIRAMLLDEAVEIDVTTQAGQQNALRFEARGKVDAQTLAQHFKGPLFTYFKGQSSWLATLRVADSEKGVPSAVLRIESLLKGMAIALPAPLNKSAAQLRGLVVETALPRTANTTFNVKYGDFFKSVFSVNKNNVLERGEVRLGSGTGDGAGGNITLPSVPGWRITGELPAFSITEWLGLSGAGIEGDTRSGTASNAPQVNEVDARIGTLEVFGQSLKDVRLQAKNSAQEWSGNIASNRVTGKVRVPHDTHAPVSADFDYLELTQSNDKNRSNDENSGVKESVMDPRQLPPMRITSKRFLYHGMDFGSLNLVTSQQPMGLHVDNLQMASDATKITALGDWVVDKQMQPMTTLNLSINSNNLGKTFREFGFADTFAEGTGQAELTAHWPASPAAFTLAQLQGNLRMNLKKGRLLDVDPGAGRVFGLMALNFKGLFSKGFSFDDIAGDFVITDGNAHTSNLTMSGPSAHVAVQGRVGLAAKDYDQRITVTPRSSTALPLAGMLTGGPGLGAAVLLFQKLFQSELDRITRYQYTVKGAWDNPEFDLSSKEKEALKADGVAAPQQ